MFPCDLVRNVLHVLADLSDLNKPKLEKYWQKYLVKKLQRAALKSPVKIAVNSKYKTVDKNDQKYLFIPESQKVGEVKRPDPEIFTSDMLPGRYSEWADGK